VVLMERRAEIRVGSRLAAPAEAVWARVITPAGINDEMRPLMRMTVPRGLGDFGIDSVEPGVKIGRSWVLAFGLIPFDYDDLTLVRIEPGRGFLERSTMLSQRLWEHERTIEPEGQGACTIVDRVAWEPRLPLPGALFRPLIGAFFRHRHARLRRRFGGKLIATAE
jgi:ligand-binding SRPBCC domain-containing protein